MSVNIILNSVEPESGTSTITANLALLAAISGYRVCVIDTHFKKPYVHSQLGAEEGYLDYAFNHYLNGQCSIQQATYDLTPQLQTEIAGRIFLSPANTQFEPTDPQGWNGYDLKLIQKGVDNLRETLEIDIFFIDTPAGLNAMTMKCMKLGHQLVLVTNPGKETYLDGSVTDKNSLDLEKVSFIVNKVAAETDLPALSEETEKSLQRPVIATLPQVVDITTANSQAFVLRHPPHPLTQQLKQGMVSLLAHM